MINPDMLPPASFGVLLDYDTFLRNKMLFCKLYMGLFEQYNVETYILATKEQYNSGLLRKYEIFGALVEKTENKSNAEILKEIGAGPLANKIHVCIMEIA